MAGVPMTAYTLHEHQEKAVEHLARNAVHPCREYRDIHQLARKTYGRAAEHLCIACFSPAVHWAYLYTGYTKICPDSLRAYSVSLDDYAPMCRPCHVSHDTPEGGNHTPEQRALSSITATRTLSRKIKCPDCDLRTNEANLANHYRATGHNNTERKAHTDKQLANSSQRAQANNARRFKCGDCDLITNPGTLGRHQKYRGHEGRSEVMPS